MSFACQMNSYLAELTTSVKTCDPVTNKLLVQGQKTAISGFNVTLEDTILFPEGGGQPHDLGTINGVEVLKVTRDKCTAVHFVKTAIAPGTDVHVKVDWERRFDHMQQHTGQHLITALADSMFGFKTTSWWLGDDSSYIQLNTECMSRDQLRSLEDRVNARIRDALPVLVHVYPSKDDRDLKQFRCRGLPDDHEGPVRVIEITDLDRNLCCGTHVSNLSHLQAVKLLYSEKGKKNSTNLWFIVGDRLLSYVHRCVKVEKSLNTTLSGPLDQHPQLAEKMMKSFKQIKKMNMMLLREIAAKEVARYKNSPDPDGLLSLHRKDGDMDYMNAVLNELNDENTTVFMTAGETSGLFLIRGEEEFLKLVETEVTDVLDGKGVVKQTRFQGKANKLGKTTQVEQYLRKIIQKNITYD